MACWYVAQKEMPEGASDAPTLVEAALSLGDTVWMEEDAANSTVIPNSRAHWMVLVAMLCSTCRGHERDVAFVSCVSRMVSLPRHLRWSQPRAIFPGIPEHGSGICFATIGRACDAQQTFVAPRNAVRVGYSDPMSLQCLSSCHILPGKPDEMFLQHLLTDGRPEDFPNVPMFSDEKRFATHCLAAAISNYSELLRSVPLESDPGLGAIALKIAVANRYSSLIRTMVSRGCRIDPAALSVSGSLDDLVYLLQTVHDREGEQECATINSYNFTGLTPLQAAVARKDIQAAEALLQHGADPNKQWFWSALELAATFDGGDADMCRLLIAHGAVIPSSVYFSPSFAARVYGHEASRAAKAQSSTGSRKTCCIG